VVNGYFEFHGKVTVFWDTAFFSLFAGG